MGKSTGRKLLKNEEGDNCDAWWWLVHKNIGASFLCIAVFALLIRVAVSFHPYSGAGNPPKFGDFEAQRHWMEITINLPTKEWYRNSTTNDLNYWGLDYPPLTAYQSYVHGLFLRTFHPESVSLFTSRGHESYFGKLLMRWTVLSSDILFLFPAVFFFVVAYCTGRERKSDIAWFIAMILFNPCLILIDHGHFQYNCISLGLTIGAVAAILSDKDLLACVLFSLALNHKQMSAYFAPAFFSHLLGKCLRCRYPILEVSKLGLVVIGTFAVIWWPYLHSMDASLRVCPYLVSGGGQALASVMWLIHFETEVINKPENHVLSRLAPFERGLYEDYVANFWCTTSVLVKWKRLFSIKSLKLLSFSATILTCLPSMIQQIWAPSNQGFLYGLLNSSFSFYLFSFQVHEKSILLPLLPASLLALEEPFHFRWLTHYALLSMFPLMCRDKLILPYVALFALFYLLYHVPGGREDRRKMQPPYTLRSFMISFLVLCSLFLHLIYITLQPPDKYPFLYEAVIMLLCFSQFVLLTIYTNAKQWMLLKHSTLMDKDKKLV